MTFLRKVECLSVSFFKTCLFLSFFPLFSFAFVGEFAEFLVSVAVRLTNTNCVYLANYFNFPPPVIELVRRDLETPGITLINIMRERNVINMHDVTGLQRALSGLELNDINEVLVIPYQERIDFFR
ncbi:hypothetical protein HOLleu_21368 [Holothuria leucospilota]|uniref:Uncharacterized protein n=1 Tax=Holothuria leucospilota TaxID=206669 RepID=A0A9Q1BX79_HOLLE|nr:hypothetical protein HOLleu_21368 [Holothuria leucospilota]